MTADAAREALKLAAGWFREYEAMHHAKGPEGTAKAEINANRAAALEAVLNRPPPAGHVEPSREAIAGIIDREAFLTLREIAAERGLDADNPPVGVAIMDEIDAPIPNRADRRDAALGKADQIRALYKAHVGAGAGWKLVPRDLPDEIVNRWPGDQPIVRRWWKEALEALPAHPEAAEMVGREEILDEAERSDLREIIETQLEEATAHNPRGLVAVDISRKEAEYIITLLSPSYSKESERSPKTKEPS